MLKPHALPPPRTSCGVVRSTRLVKVIEVQARFGAGTEDDPVRIVTQFWSACGALLAERDDYANAAEVQP